MPVVLKNNKSAFEQEHFDRHPAVVDFPLQHLQQHLNQPVCFDDNDIRNLAGAPCGSRIACKYVASWSDSGDDRPKPGLYFLVRHPAIINGNNAIGLCWGGPGIGYTIYIKDVFFNGQAAAGIGPLALAKIVRFCLQFDIRKIELLAAGGRTWPDIRNAGGVSLGRWAGYYFWARCGFDMPLQAQDRSLFQYFQRHPAHLINCTNVRDVIKEISGREWWKVCGTGCFMEFDCTTPRTASVQMLEAYLAEKGI